jgi:hypothetical protein
MEAHVAAHLAEDSRVAAVHDYVLVKSMLLVAAAVANRYHNEAVVSIQALFVLAAPDLLAVSNYSHYYGSLFREDLYHMSLVGLEIVHQQLRSGSRDLAGHCCRLRCYVVPMDLPIRRYSDPCLLCLQQVQAEEPPSCRVFPSDGRAHVMLRMSALHAVSVVADIL